MRKFFFVIFAILTTTTAWPAPQFTITCDDMGGKNCNMTDGYQNFVVNKCSDIAEIQGKKAKVLKPLKKDTPIIVDTDKAGSICATSINAARQNTDCEDNDIRTRYINNYFAVFCASGNYLDTLGTMYDNIIDADWSYDKKKCVGSGGKYDNGNCTCTNDQTTPQNGECICKNGNQKYLLNNNCQEGAACTSTGGEPVASSSSCICPETMQSVKIRPDSEVEMCECKDGYHYRDPMRRWEGCVKIKDTVTISGTIVSHDNQNETLPGVNLIVNDASLSIPKGVTTNIDGKFQLDEVPNTAYITISSVGFKQQIRPAIELNNTTIKLVPTPQKLGEVEVKEISECTKTGGTTNDGGKTCDCPDGFTTETINENAQKCVATAPVSAAEDKGEEEPITDETSVTPSPDPKELAEKLKTAQNELAAAKEKENSWANRGLSAASTAMTGLGGMQLAQGIAEKKADADAEKEMRAYIETMKCDYGGGKNITMGNEEITLPGGNELLEYYTEYKTLADNLKTTKAALGLRSGIESEVLYDRAQSGLYQYASTGKTGGAEISLYRALTDSDSEDAARWAEQEENASKKLKAGAIVAGAGIATGIVGNYLINGRNTKHEELKQDLRKKQEETENRYANDILIRPQTGALGANYKFDMNLPEFKPETNNTETSAVEQTAPVQDQLTKLNIKDTSLFPTGGYQINKDNDILNKYANDILEVLNREEYKDVNIKINIVGHTDKVPVRKIKGRAYQNNKELSNLRASEVANYLSIKLKSLESRIKYEHKGMGYDECTKDGDQPECRRVEITATDETNYDAPQ